MKQYPKIIVNGGEHWIPFAKNCIYRMLLTGVGYVSKTFLMPDGFNVSASISGDFSYINIDGNTNYVCSYTNNRVPTEPWDVVTRADGTTTNHVSVKGAAMYRSRRDFNKLGELVGAGYPFPGATYRRVSLVETSVSPLTRRELVAVTYYKDGQASQSIAVLSAWVILKEYQNSQYENYIVYPIKCHRKNPSMLEIKKALSTDGRHTYHYAIITLNVEENEGVKEYSVVRKEFSGSYTLETGVFDPYSHLYIGMHANPNDTISGAIVEDFDDGYYLVLSKRVRSSENNHSSGNGGFTLLYLDSKGGTITIDSSVTFAHFDYQLEPVYDAELLGAATGIIVSASDNVVHVIVAEGDVDYPIISSITGNFIIPDDPDYAWWLYQHLYSYTITKTKDENGKVISKGWSAEATRSEKIGGRHTRHWLLPMYGAVFDINGFIWSEHGCLDLHDNKFFRFSFEPTFNSMSWRYDNFAGLDLHGAASYLSVSPNGLSARLYYTWHSGSDLGDETFPEPGLLFTYRLVFKKNPDGTKSDELELHEDVVGIDSAAWVGPKVWEPLNPGGPPSPTKWNYSSARVPHPVTLLAFPGTTPKKPTPVKRASN